MNLESSKLELVKLIVNIDNERLIEKILHVLKSEQENFQIELTENERKEIELGINQLDSGHRISLENFLKKFS